MQIVSITSERLQAAIRRLLPSQAGFSEDLEAVNTIQPIIDLTPTAEGDDVPLALSQALTYDSTVFQNSANATSVATASGFYRIVGTCTMVPDSSSQQVAKIEVFDGAVYKIVYGWILRSNSNSSMCVDSFDLLIFLAQGESILTSTDNIGCVLQGTCRQVADSNGATIDPPGFEPQ